MPEGPATVPDPIRSAQKHLFLGGRTDLFSAVWVQSFADLPFEEVFGPEEFEQYSQRIGIFVVPTKFERNLQRRAFLKAASLSRWKSYCAHEEVMKIDKCGFQLRTLEFKPLLQQHTYPSVASHLRVVCGVRRGCRDGASQGALRRGNSNTNAQYSRMQSKGLIPSFSQWCGRHEKETGLSGCWTLYRKVHPHANAFECTLPANLRSAVLPNEKCYCEQDLLTIWTSLTFISPVSELSFVTPVACPMLFVPSFTL